MTLRESIRLNRSNGVKHTPELKAGDAGQIQSVFGGQDQYARSFAEVLEDENVRPRDAWPQSFNVNDVLYWIDHTRYGDQAAFRIDYDDVKDHSRNSRPFAT
jgi:glycerophosphoryl diester phosphodiesterase